jgi:hypothetical protein
LLLTINIEKQRKNGSGVGKIFLGGRYLDIYLFRFFSAVVL